MSCNKTALNALMLIIILALGLSAAQIADAGQPISEVVEVYAAPQQVDTDGDGRLETFSADYTVYADGTAEGRIQLAQDDTIIIESGTIDLDPDSNLIVSATGTSLQHEIGHTLGFRHEHTSSGRGTSSSGGGDIILVDIVGPQMHTFSVSLQYICR